MAQVDRPADSDWQPLRELAELTRSAGACVCERMVLTRSKPVAATFIGKGKAQEIGQLVKRHDATLVIFDSPDIADPGAQPRRNRSSAGCSTAPA